MNPSALALSTSFQVTLVGAEFSPDSDSSSTRGRHSPCVQCGQAWVWPAGREGVRSGASHTGLPSPAGQVWWVGPPLQRQPSGVHRGVATRRLRCVAGRGANPQVPQTSGPACQPFRPESSVGGPIRETRGQQSHLPQPRPRPPCPHPPPPRKKLRPEWGHVPPSSTPARSPSPVRPLGKEGSE